MAGPNDEQPEAIRKVCASCGALSPKAQTSYTLISSKHAWRITLQSGASGEKEPVWYCPRCWEREKTR